MGCCDFSLNNPLFSYVTFNVKHYILSQIFYKKNQAYIGHQVNNKHLLNCLDDQSRIFQAFYNVFSNKKLEK